MASNTPPTSQPSTSFITTSINRTTYLLIEDDSFSEQPHIYIKIHPLHILITDTGCNSPRLPHLSITSLRQYLETYPIPQNNHQPLNPGGKKEYIIICTHCHYDHILGLNSFLPPSPQQTQQQEVKAKTNPTIIASSHSKPFIQNDLPTHSLCKYIPLPVPPYTISVWANHLSSLTLPNQPPSYSFRIQFLHIPGHTPDSLAWYDIDEQHLFIGDTFYARRRSVPIPGLPDEYAEEDEMSGAIQFPNEGGNFIQYMSSLDLLLSFTYFKNAELKRRVREGGKVPRVKVSTGHITTGDDAEDMIREVKGLFKRIIKGRVVSRGSLVKRGVVYEFWMERDEGEGKQGRYSVLAPRRLVEEARRHFHPERGLERR